MLETCISDFINASLEPEIKCESALKTKFKSVEFHKKIENYKSALGKILNVFCAKDVESVCILKWFKEYGACVISVAKLWNPLQVWIYVIGTDGWTFTVSPQGSHQALSGQDPAFLSVSTLESSDIEEFKCNLDAALKMEKEKPQKTPGFIWASCFKVIYEIKKRKKEGSDLQELSDPEKGGFTDVGKHSGCSLRDVSMGLCFSVIRIIMKVFMKPALKNAHAHYLRFMTEFYYQLSENNSNELKKSFNKDALNLAMEHLKVASRYGNELIDTNYWPDCNDFLKKFKNIRTSLEKCTLAHSSIKSEEFVLKVPDLNELQKTASPFLKLEKLEMETGEVMVDEASILNSSKTNLGWFQNMETKSLEECLALIESNSCSFSYVFSKMKAIFSSLAQRYLSPEGDAINQLDFKKWIQVTGEYVKRLEKFMETEDSKALMKVNLLSHIVLVKWIEFCFLFEFACSVHPILKKYSPSLDYNDLEHLVLSEKSDWDLVLVLSRYLKRKQGNPRVFSGRKDEEENMFNLADDFVCRYEKFDKLWKLEQEDAEKRVEDRWEIIQKKKEICRRLAHEIKALQESREEALTKRNLLDKRVPNENGRFYTNPEWKKFQSLAVSFQHGISAKSSQYHKENIAPIALYQPLPNNEKLGKRALFFCHMPDIIGTLWNSSYEAQSTLFPLIANLNNQDSNLQGSYCNFYAHYDAHSKYKANVKTPFVLYCDKPPTKLGNERVENISHCNDGIWYPDTFRPIMVWRYNPFIVSRSKAVERFTADCGSKTLQWAIMQKGKETELHRGNIALALQNKKPDSWNTQNYLAFGTIRASPINEIMNLLEAINLRSLPLEYHETYILIRSTLYHIGELKENDEGDLFMVWKKALFDEQVLEMFRFSLDKMANLLKESPQNHLELLICLEMNSFLSQFNPETFKSLVDLYSNIALQWANVMENEIQRNLNLGNESSNADAKVKKHLFLIYSILAYEKVSGSCGIEKIGEMIKLIVQIRLSKPLNVNAGASTMKLNDLAKKLMIRVNLMLARIMPNLSSIQNGHLTNAVKRVFPHRVDDNMRWTYFNQSKVCFYAKNKAGQLLSINIMNGITLLNGLPPTSLPFKISQHPLYVKVFGKDTNFLTDFDNDGTARTVYPTFGRFYSFKAVENELTVFEELNQGKDSGLKLRLLDSSKINLWGSELPIALQELYSHWQCDELGVVVFRPIDFKKRDIFYLYYEEKLYQIIKEDMQLPLSSLIEKASKYDRLLFLTDSSILSVFEKFDQLKYIYPFLTENGSFKVLFVRYRLSFKLCTGKDHFESLDHSSFVLKSHQQLTETFYGFYDYLVLESLEKQMILVPHGLAQQEEGKVWITRNNESLIDAISANPFSYNSFSVHQKLNEFQASTIEARIQLAMLHAATSTFVPEKWTGKTGFEMAIQLLRQCWINRPMSTSEFSLLQNLLELKSLPPSLVIICHLLYDNSKLLSFLYPNEPVHSGLNEKQYITAINAYSLPAQYQGPLKNYRLLLKDEESLFELGTNETGESLFELGTNETGESLKQFEHSVLGTRSCPDYKPLNIKIWEKNFKNLIFEDKDDVKPKECHFPLEIPKDSPLFESKIAKKLIFDLKESYRAFCSIKRSRLSKKYKLIQTDCEEMLKKVIEKKFDLELKVKDQVNMDNKDLQATKLLMLKAANIIPEFTLADMVKCAWQPNRLSWFNPMLTQDEKKYLQSMIIDYMALSVLEARIQRAMNLLKQGKLDEFIREVQIHRTFDPREHPEWLAFEFDQGIQIRPEQMDVISDILENNNLVSQLNMGLGKTRVILPCLYLELSKKNNITRIFLLSTLFNEGFAYLHKVLTGGIFERKLFRFPFHRDIQLTENQSLLIYGSARYCLYVKGVIIQAPEERLSLHLKKCENLGKKDECVSKALMKIDALTFADIYDEVDEIMNPMRQLIYADGAPELLDCGDRRWQVFAAVLFCIRHHPDVAQYLKDQKIVAKVEAPHQEYNMLRLLPGEALEKSTPGLLNVLIEAMLSFEKISFYQEKPLKLGTKWMEYICDNLELKKRIISFTTHLSSTVSIIESDFEKIEHYQDVLALRGLLAHGILVHCLSLRHGVKYGVVKDHKTPMAIPFHAANQPNLRSEFAQADCAIGFTFLSYYHVGLTRDQMCDALKTLLLCGPSFQRRIYNEIYSLFTASNSEELTEIDMIDKIDLSNQIQVDLLYQALSKNMLLINFWLSSVIFPCKTMTFPGKLVATSWDLTDPTKSVKRWGFSGTDDSCLLLPFPLHKRESKSAFLKGTNGKMVNHLLTKASFARIPDSEEAIEDVLIQFALDKKVDTFIDAGALLSNVSNHEIARKFLVKFVDEQFKGVVFFDCRTQAWSIIDRKERICRLDSSSIHESEAFVIYDQSRCRGADLKLKSKAVAFLTLCPKLRKDELMQAAGRLRKLDYGQSIIVIAANNTENLVRNSVKISPNETIEMKHIILYTLANSIKFISDGLKNYANQGVHFLQCSADSQNVRQKDFSTLKDMYASSKNEATVAKHFESILQDVKPLAKNQSIMDSLKKLLIQFGSDVHVCSSDQFEECEREFEYEQELEEQVEKQLPEMVPLEEKDWDFASLLIKQESVGQLGSFVISVSNFIKGHIESRHVQSLGWSVSKIFMTANFAFPLKDAVKLDSFLRPLRYLLYFPQSEEILLISDREADQILLLYRSLSEADLALAPRLCNHYFSQHSFIDSPNSADAHLVAKKSIPLITACASNLFNGSTSIEKGHGRVLMNDLILNSEAANSAFYFVEKRGFKLLIEGSELEAILEKIHHVLFVQSQFAQYQFELDFKNSLKL